MIVQIDHKDILLWNKITLWRTGPTIVVATRIIRCTTLLFHCGNEVVNQRRARKTSRGAKAQAVNVFEARAEGAIVLVLYHASIGRKAKGLSGDGRARGVPADSGDVARLG